MILRTKRFSAVIICLLCGCANASLLAQLSGVLSSKPYLENQAFHSVVPIETSGNKISLDARINGKPYRFILDTGSPTMLTKKAADALELEKRGENTGKDANGNLVKTDLSVLDRLEIGNVEFRNIPVFIHDFSQLAAGDCVIDGGIIGSEIMPLANWQINFKEKELVLTNDSSQLGYIDKAKKAKLEVYSYPYAPVLEYKINGKFSDRAMFDTGSTELLQLNQLAFEELKRRKIVKTISAKALGAFGESAGGRGEDTDFYLVPLKQLSIGKLRFENVEVWTRPEIPSLIGSKIFESQVVTLDYANKVVYFYEYDEQRPADVSFGFKLYLQNQSVFVGFLRESSLAAKAGLQLHDQILKINQTELNDLDISELCDIFEWLSAVNELPEIEITFESGEVTKQALLKKE